MKMVTSLNHIDLINSMQSMMTKPAFYLVFTSQTKIECDEYSLLLVFYDYMLAFIELLQLAVLLKAFSSVHLPVQYFFLSECDSVNNGAHMLNCCFLSSRMNGCLDSHHLDLHTRPNFLAQLVSFHLFFYLQSARIVNLTEGFGAEVILQKSTTDLRDRLI